MNSYDTIIIGSGPAGISAAIYLKRYNLNPLIITTKSSALMKAKIENYYGIKSIDGASLWADGINQATNLGIDIKYECVTSIEYLDNFLVKTDISEYNAKTVFIATGLSRKKSTIKNLDNFLGSGISQCATCDGFFFRNKKIGIVGSEKFMEAELEVLKRFTKDITIFSNGINYTNNDFEVCNEKIIEVYGDTKFKGVKTETKSYDLDGLFLAIGTANALDFASHLGLRIDNNNLYVDSTFMTNFKGIFAGGDAIGGLLQVSKAVSDGAQAALAIKNYLK